MCMERMTRGMIKDWGTNTKSKQKRKRVGTRKLKLEIKESEWFK